LVAAWADLKFGGFELWRGGGTDVGGFEIGRL